MKKLKSLIIKTLSLCIVLVFLMSVSPVTYAAENLSPSVYTSEESITPRTEETAWYYRTYNGKIQMRLWSYTEGKWLTDWIDVGTAA